MTNQVVKQTKFKELHNQLIVECKELGINLFPNNRLEPFKLALRLQKLDKSGPAVYTLACLVHLMRAGLEPAHKNKKYIK